MSKTQITYTEDGSSYEEMDPPVYGLGAITEESQLEDAAIQASDKLSQLEATDPVTFNKVLDDQIERIAAIPKELENPDLDKQYGRVLETERQLQEHPVPPIHPTWARVLVRPLDVKDSDQTFANSSIIIPDEALAREQRAQTKAILVAIGGDCFADWSTRGPIPQIGQTVLVEKWVGCHVKHNDVDYQLINDDQILAVMSEG